jgi:hypothetical protein
MEAEAMMATRRGVRYDDPHYEQKMAEAREQRSRADQVFAPDTWVKVSLPTGTEIRGRVIACTRTTIYGVRVRVHLTTGETWEGTAERVRKA